MPRKKTSPRKNKIDIKKMMSTVEGRWIHVPFLLAIIAVVGMGLIVTLFDVGGLAPQWLLTGPAGVLVTAYYIAQIWKALRPSSPRGFTKIGQGAVIANQEVTRGGIAPIISGKQNTVTVIQQSPEGKKDSKRLRIQYVRTEPILPPEEGWYCIEIANPNAQPAVITGLEWVIEGGPDAGVSSRTSLGNPLYVEAEHGVPGDVQLGSKHLVRRRNVEIPAGYIGAFYVKGETKWRTYTVRATLHITGPLIEDLHYTDILLTPAGYAWNLSDRKTPAPPDPFATERAHLGTQDEGAT